MPPGEETAAPVSTSPCPACGDTSSEARATFCNACGAPLAVEEPAAETNAESRVVRCRRCGGTTPPGAFCVWCGSRLGPQPAFRVPRRVWLAVFGVFAAMGLAVVALAGAILYWSMQPPQARLIMWGDYGDSRLAIDDGRSLREIDRHEVALPAGEYTFYASPRGPSGGSPPESLKLRLEPGRLHLWRVGGSPVEVSTYFDGRRAEGRILGAAGRPLRLDAASHADRIVAGPGGASDDRWIPSHAQVESRGSGSRLSSGDGDLVLLVNPYDEMLRCRIVAEDFEQEFLLAAGSLRCLTPGGRIEFSATLPGQSQVLDDYVFERPPPGISLYAVGRATCFGWRNESADSAAPPAAVAPQDFVPLLADGTLDVELHVGGSSPGPGAPIVSRENASGQREQLVVLASAPLASPSPQPLAEATTHPDVRVREMVLPDVLKGRIVDAVGVRGEAMIGLVGGSPHDLATGQPLCEPGPPLATLAAASSGAVGITRQAKLARIENGRIVVGGSVFDPTLLAWSPPRGSEVFFYGGQAAGGLYLAAGEKWRQVLDAAHSVTALGAIDGGLLIAQGRKIDKLTVEDRRARLTTVLELPEGPPILGLHDADGLLIFATENACNMVTGGVVLPMVVGVGGPIHPYRDGLLVHDRASRKLCLLESPLLKAARAGPRP